ncbi:competence protein CoiA family protein [Streptomyces halobius]|uniref:competence protein CoiA family protein n=1 Tax=Streptomyces halobius TaxID=2879846 RepID=UPI0024B1BC11|nr:hypothetical protein [Streptomyces halobius]
MPLTALHDNLRVLDATCDDLDAGIDWDTIYRARPRAPLRCTACHISVHAKLSPRGRRFFAHDSAAPRCPTNGESPEHRRLKRALALAARQAGWRADVLATTPGGRRLALEAQLSPITYTDITARTYRYATSNVEACWITDTDAPWLLTVPSLQVTTDDATGELHVTDGHRALSSRPVTGLHAVDFDGDRADHDEIGLRWQHWEEALPDIPVPWTDPWRLLAAHRHDPDDPEDPGALPRANTHRARIGWWRPKRHLTLTRFLTALRHDQVLLLELAAPFRDVSSRVPDPLVWTTPDYLEEAAKLTAFAYGWRLFHRSENNPCSCGTGEPYVLSADTDGCFLYLCSACDAALIDLAADLDSWEARREYVALISDNALMYLTPRQRKRLLPQQPPADAEVTVETGLTPQEIARRLTGYGK